MHSCCLAFCESGDSGRDAFRRLPKRGRARDARLAGRAVDGRALAGGVRRRDAARRRAFADRARRKGRGHIAPRRERSSLCVVRRNRGAGRRDVAGEARARRRCAGMQECRARNHRAEQGGVARARREERLAHQRRLEPRQRKFVFGVDRETLRRAAQRSAVVEGDARGAARSVAQPPLRPSRPARGPEGPSHSARLRRRSLFPARLFRLQDGPAVRLLEMHARRRRPAAALPAMVEHRQGGAAADAARAGTVGDGAHRPVRHVQSHGAAAAATG